jgi:hypothetical protein
MPRSFGTAALVILSVAALRCGGAAEDTSRDGGGNHDGGATQDGGATPDDGVGPLPPTQHRPTADSCPTTRPPGVNEDAGLPDSGTFTQCTNDAQCTQGTNGRCVRVLGSIYNLSCTYDGCFSDTDCAGGDVCECRPSGNACLAGNCRVDSDCGAGGYCSPTLGFCGNWGGISGYYCHTPADECTNDSDCTEGGAGYCAWQPTVARWACSYSQCAG